MFPHEECFMLAKIRADSLNFQKPISHTLLYFRNLLNFCKIFFFLLFEEVNGLGINSH